MYLFFSKKQKQNEKSMPYDCNFREIYVKRDAKIVGPDETTFMNGDGYISKQYPFYMIPLKQEKSAMSKVTRVNMKSTHIKGW